jgi:hypothetical protein
MGFLEVMKSNSYVVERVATSLTRSLQMGSWIKLLIALQRNPRVTATLACMHSALWVRRHQQKGTKSSQAVGALVYSLPGVIASANMTIMKLQML